MPVMRTVFPQSFRTNSKFSWIAWDTFDFGGYFQMAICLVMSAKDISKLPHIDTTMKEFTTLMNCLS